MIELIKQGLKKEMPQNTKLNLTREILQELCLKIMSDQGLFDQVAFLGGTALRLVYNLRRYSEDLDFSSIEGRQPDMANVSECLERGFRLHGLSVETKPREVGAVRSVMLQFRSLLKEVGISPLKDEVLAIKWDVDTRPPAGAVLESKIIEKHFGFRIVHYDLPSLFAGKLHACFFRNYTKGRDWYDFVWYVARGVMPNFLLLNNAIEQTEKKDLRINETNLSAFLTEHVHRVDFSFVRRDVERFLEDPAELSIFDPQAIIQTIRASYERRTE